MRVTRTVAIAALASLSLLSGCGSDYSDTSSDTTSSGSPVPAEPIEVYPAAGTMNGVVSAEVPTYDDGVDQVKLQYGCAEGFTAVPFSQNAEVEFNGTEITVENAYSDMAPIQIGKIISLSGATSGFNPVSLITSTTNTSYDASLATDDPGQLFTRYGNDDQVVNITSDMIANGRLQLDAVNFHLLDSYPEPDSEYTITTYTVASFQFCVAPATPPAMPTA